MSAPSTPPPCKGCDGPKPARLYLCRGCWWTLQPGVRAALNRRDDHALRRLSDLLDAIRQGTALNKIEVTR